MASLTGRGPEGHPRSLLSKAPITANFFEPVFLPPYSPDLNPIERLWLIMKAEWFSGFYAKTKDQLIDRLTQALRWLIDRKNENVKTCAIPTEL